MESRIAHQSKFEAVMISVRRINHILHLILSILTLGVWLIVWALMGIFGGENQYTLRVDEYGKVTYLGPFAASRLRVPLGRSG